MLLAIQLTTHLGVRKKSKDKKGGRAEGRKQMMGNELKGDHFE